MEVDEAQTQAPRLSRIRGDGGASIFAVGDGDSSRLRSWQHSSRIIRVSRASGGKDRHSKVWTAKGPRDRRVRLSVATAIQFYDLQDRLGVDQPSKAVEWLIKVAADSISELPSLGAAFPETPRQVSDEKRPGLGLDSSAEVEIQRSEACSSNSESGGLSLSRNEIRVKARERARERTAKEKERESTPGATLIHQQMNQSSSSFTQLLTAGIGNMDNASNSAMDYLMGNSSSGSRGGGFSGMHQAMMTAVSSSSPYSVGGEQQHFPFIADQDQYNLNFSISPSNSSALAAGFNNRGTLQSNSSQSLLSQQQQQQQQLQLQRFSVSPFDGTTVPFFLGAPVDNQHHQHGGANLIPPGLQLYYGDNGGRQSDQKGKRKP